MRLEQRRTRDLRQWPRFPAPGSKPIKADLGPAGAGTLLDISSGGVRVQSIAPLRRGVELPIRIYLPQCAEVIQSSGKVMWSQSSALAGIRFGILTQAQHQALDLWLAEVARNPEGDVKEEKSFFGLLIEMQERNLSYSEALRFIARRVIDLTPATGAAISLGSREDTVRMVSVGQAPPYGVRISTNDGILGDCSRRRKVIHIQNAEVDPRIAPIKKGFKFGSAVVLPLSIHGEVRGFLEAFSNTPYAFNAKSIEVLERLADATVIVEQEFTPSSTEGSTSEAHRGNGSPISVSVSADVPPAAPPPLALPESELPVFAAEITEPNRPELADTESKIPPANLDTVTLFKTIRAAAPSLVLPSAVVDAIIEAKEKAAQEEDVLPVDLGPELQSATEELLHADETQVTESTNLDELVAALASVQQDPPQLEDVPEDALPKIEGPVEQSLPEIDSFIENLVSQLEQAPERFRPIEQAPVLPNLTLASETVAAFAAESEATPIPQPVEDFVMAGSMFPSVSPNEVLKPALEQSDVSASQQTTSSTLVVLPKPAAIPDQAPTFGVDSKPLNSRPTGLIVTSAAALLLVFGGLYFWKSTPAHTPVAAATSAAATPVTTPAPAPVPTSASTPAAVPAKPAPKQAESRPQLVAERISPVEVALPIILPAGAPQHKNGNDAPAPSLTQIASTPSAGMPNIIPDTSSVPQLVRESKPPIGGVLIKQINPVFPPMARQMRVDGEVQLQIRVGKDGKVRSVKRLSGLAILANAATEAVKEWRYTPTVVDGHPVEVDKIIILKFKR